MKCFVVILPADSRLWPWQWTENIYFYHLHHILDNRLTQQLRVILDRLEMSFSLKRVLHVPLVAHEVFLFYSFFVFPPPC